MPRPADPMTLIDPPNPDFREIDGWEMKFARYQWFYVAGYRKLMNDAGIYDLSAVKSHSANALAALPDAWRQSVPNGDWNNLAENQVERAINAEPLRLEKAFLAVICLELAIAATVQSGRGRNVDIFAPEASISIRPALFYLRNFDETFFSSAVRHSPDVLTALRLATAQRKDKVFEKLAQGYAVTCRTAVHTCTTLQNLFTTDPRWHNPIDILDRRARRDKNDRPLRKKPNEDEVIIYP